jgi:predicted MPP superfamily phosphohydrolase
MVSRLVQINYKSVGMHDFLLCGHTSGGQNFCLTGELYQHFLIDVYGIFNDALGISNYAT